MSYYTPIEYLKMDIAARFGMDKVNWDERLEWFENNSDNLHTLAATAKEPALYYAAVCAWEDHLMGVPSGYGPQFDCTASGLQLLSIITNDHDAARICNVTGNDIQDAYLEIYKVMQGILGEERPINRDDVKQAVMTGFYGSEAEPKKLFGTDTPELAAFFEAMEQAAPKCWALNNTLLEYQKANTDDYYYEWVMPDNFHVHCKVMEKVTETVECLGHVVEVGSKVNRPHQRNRSLCANMTHSIESYNIRELKRRTSVTTEDLIRINLVLNGGEVLTNKNNQRMTKILWNHYKKSGMLSARILDYLDSETITMVNVYDIRKLLSTIRGKYDVRLVHDCISVLPNNASKLLLLFKTLYAELARGDLLVYLLTQITGDTVTMNDDTDRLDRAIMQSSYNLA